MSDENVAPDAGQGRMRIERVEEMPVFQLFYGLALTVERATREFPRDFLWLRSQSCRSSESVCANMTEGFYTQYSTEYLQSLCRCRREARETMLHISYAKDSGVAKNETCLQLLKEYDEGAHQLNNLIGSIERKIQSRGKSKPGSNLVREDEAEYGPAEDILHPSSTINHQPSTISHQPFPTNPEANNG